ncbi:MAG: hypothetical protein WC847_01665 [Candidatus Paceibacterota bacterium]|jgi:hypothetical protein
MLKQKFYIVIVLVLTLAFSTKALASLTFSSAAITGTTASTIDVGSGNALSLQTTNGGNIITGSGNVGIGITPTNKLTVSGTSNFTGHMAIGPTALVDSGGIYPNMLDIEDTLSISSNGAAIAIYTIYDPTINGLDYFGTDSNVTIPITNNKNISQVIGNNNNVISNGSGNITVSMEGGDFAAYQSGTGSVTSLRGINAEAVNEGSLSIAEQSSIVARVYNTKVGSTITNIYGLRIRDIVSNAGTFTNTYGIYIGDVSIGTQTNYPFSLYSSDANSYNYFAGNVGVGVTAPSQKLEVNGGVRLNTVTAKPTCDVTVRGTLWTAQGGAGVADTAEICRKGAADTYSWVTIY